MPLTLELVKAIKEAEGKAEKHIRDAQQEARQLIREAEETALKVIKSVVAAAEDEAKELIRKAEDEAKADTVPLCDKQKAVIDRLKKEAAGRLPDAVALLKEKVVSSDANH
jgi:V/A-type H+/Na+-transporting ATPase subunit G/H